jgi:hypothetical protein
MKQLLKLFGPSLVPALWALFALLFLFLAANQIDAVRTPEVKALMETPLEISESERLFYESFVVRDYCHRGVLNLKQQKDILDAVVSGAPFHSYFLDDIYARTSCLQRILNPAGSDKLLEGLSERHHKDQKEAESVIKSAVALSLILLNSPSTAAEQGLAARLLEKTIAQASLIQEKTNRMPGVPRKDVRAVLAIPTKDRLHRIRDAEVQIAGTLIDKKEGFREVTTGFWGTFFFLPNKTVNKLYSNWNQSIDQALKCKKIEDCRGLKKTKMKLSDYLVNMSGNSINAFIYPNPGELRILIESSFARVESHLND